jgi:uncharacterized DUF497 family protein
MGFEWDEQKRAINKAKHGLDFLDVRAVFDDEKAYVYPARNDFGEKRFVIVGQIRDLIVATVYTERGANKRLISARIARREERAHHGRK